MCLKSQVFEELMKQILNFIEKFKSIDNAVDSLCKRLSKTSISSVEFSEVLKLYNITGQMFTRALEILDSIICRFPQELNPDELEMLENYRNLSEAKRYIHKMRIKEDIESND